MSWEPDTEENRLGKVRKELDDLKASTSFLNTPINDGASSNSLGVGFGVSSFNQGANGDIPQQIENFLEDVSGTFWGIVDVVGSLLVITDGGSNEQVANQSTIRKLNGGVDGQKTVIKPALGKTVKLINNPNTNSSTDGNLLLGADLVLTDTESVTLRFTTDILYIDSYENNDPTATPQVIIQKIGGWIIESTGSGSGNSTSGVLKDPVKVATTTNVTNLNFSSPIDGIAMTVGDRFLVKNQTDPIKNGIYIWANGSASTRASDMSSGSVQKEGTMTYVQDGLTQNEILYAINIGGNNILVDTNPNTWGEIGSGSGGGSGSIKSPVKYATTANITLSGEQSIDGTTTVTNRVLVKDQTTASENGIYVTASSSWARSTDMSTGSTIEGGAMVYVTDGTVNGDNLFGLTTEGTVTVGTGNQAWANLTAGGANTALSNLALTTSINSDLTMQNGFSIANLERVAFNTRTSSSVAGSISYDGTNIFAKGSGAEINLTSGFPTLTGNNIFSGINTFSQSIVAGGAGEGMTTIGHLDFVNNSATPVATVSLYSDGTDLFSTTNIDLNNKDLKSVDDIFFHTSGISINTDSVGMVLQVPANDTIDFLVDGSRMTLSETVLDIKLPTTMTTNGITFTTGDLTMGTGEIIAGGAQKEIRNIGELVFVDNTISPAGNGIIYFNGTDVKVKTGGNTVNLTNVSGANFTDATFRITDELDLTKKFAFDVGSISTGTVRTMTIPDADINMGGLTNSNLATGTFGSITGVGSQSQSLNMNNNDIIAVSGLDLDGSTATIEGVANLNFYHTNRNINSVTGTMNALAYSVNTNEKHSFQVAGSEVLTIATGDIDFIGDLDMHTYDITSVDRLKFSTVQGSGTALTTSDTGIEAIYTGSNPYGMKIQFPSTNSGVLQIQRGSTIMMNISSFGTTLTDVYPDNIFLSTDKFIQFDKMTSTNVGTTPTDKRRLFSDENNNDELSVKKSDGSIQSLEGGGGSQTPWTSNIDANSKNLTGLGYLRYNTSGISTTGVEGQLWFDGENFKASTATGLQYNLTENSHITWLDHETNQLDYDIFISNMPNGIVRTQTSGSVDAGGATVSIIQNQAYYLPFYIGKQCKIDEIGFLPFDNYFNGNGQVNWGIYTNRSSGTSTDPNQYYPETQVANGNFYLGNNLEFQRGVNINQTLYKGWYWIAFNNSRQGLKLYAQPYGGGQATSVGNFLNTFGNDTIRPIHGYFTTDSGSIDPTPDDEMTPIDGYAYPVSYTHLTLPTTPYV